MTIDCVYGCIEVQAILSRQVRRFSYAPPPGAGGNDNSSFLSILGMAGVIGGVAYVYYDPDVLPEPVKQWLPIEEPKGHGMSLEEYEKWRARQAGYPTDLLKTKEEPKQEEVAEDSDDVTPPEEGSSSTTVETTDLPVPHGDVSPAEMKASLEKLLSEARDNEAAYIADLKKSKAALSEEDRQMLQAFKDEKARIKKQLRFIKHNK
ncbi:TPA: hypothetical protein N0F65_002892 [Lagenidium giganteum]|uniref:Uncharacterized protein n=1 Tax=Lagenidium giganteum TaxID=4803 RepID=A0AAV2ZDJ1_9STRA|nr:TPA: hypothetical protein N0F65_002892 [Lagenidium giganteum]